tara:strand:- start:36657 stop:38627 length:1971 start_codon:yes stop_codon:yes gene_type:complete
VKFLKITLLIIILIPTLLIAALIVVPEKVDFSIYKEQIESYIKTNTGLTVSLGEELSIKLLPQPHFSANNVYIKSFLNEKNIFHADKVDLTTSLKDLLSMNLSIKKMLVENPSVYLHRNIENEANWQPKRVKRNSSNSVDLSFIKGLGDIVISNISFVYEDDLNGSQFRLLEGQIAVDGGKLENTGIVMSGLLNDVNVESNILLNLSNGAQSNVDGFVSLAQNKLSFNGDIAELFYNPSYVGEFNLEGPAVFDSLYKVFGIAPGQRHIKFPLALSGTTSLSSAMYAFEDVSTTFAISPTSVTFVTNASFEPSQSSRTPGKFLGSINSAEYLDLSPLSFCAKGKKSNDSFEWSDEIIDFTFLKQLDAEFKIDAPLGLKCSDKKFDSVQVLITVKDGLLDIKDAVLGNGNGVLKTTGSLNVRGQKAKGSVVMESNGFDLISFMSADAHQRVELPINLNMNLDFEGKSVLEWVEALRGKIDMSSASMTTVGLNTKSLQSVVTSLFGLEKGTERMEQGSFTMNAEVSEGILRTENAVFSFPKITVESQGKVDLTRMVMSLKAQPSTENLIGYDIPVLIKGSVFSPIILPDVSSTKTQGAAIGAVLGGPVGAVIGSGIGSMLDGGSKNTPPTPPESSKKINENIDEKQKLEQEVLRFLQSE